jgi:hypothetical protein
VGGQAEHRPSRASAFIALALLLLTAAPAAATDHTYDSLDGELANPERGLYQSIDLVNETELGWVRDTGSTLAFAYIRLDAARVLDTPTAKAQIREALLDAVPDDRMVQFRYLPDIETWAPEPITTTASWPPTTTPAPTGRETSKTTRPT